VIRPAAMNVHDPQTRQTIVRLLSSMGSAKEIDQYLRRFAQLDAERFAVVKVGGAVLRDDLDALAARLRPLLPQLADDGRAIVVASGTHKAQRLRNFGFPPPRWDEPAALAQPGPGSGQVAYATSKLANVLFALELARRIDALRPGARIAVHALDPGLMPATGLARDYPAPVAALYRALAPRLLRAAPGVATPAASGAQLARMVADPAYAAPPNGRYVELTRDATPVAAARDAAQLWDESERLLGLSPR